MTVIHLPGEVKALHTLAEVHRTTMALNGPLLAVRGYEQVEPKRAHRASTIAGVP